MIHMTISGLVNKLLFILLILLAEMIVSIVLAIIRKRKNKKRNATAAFVWHGVNVLVFAILEVAMWYFIPILLPAKVIPAILVFITIVVYAGKGYREESGKGKIFRILIPALAAFILLETLLIGDYTLVKGILLIVIYLLFMNAAYFLLWKKPKEETETT